MRFFVVMFWKYLEIRFEKWGKILFFCIIGTVYFLLNFVFKKKCELYIRFYSSCF